MDAVPKIYIRSLKHSALGFALVAPQAILQLTVKRYDIISPKDIEDNLAKLNAPWNPDTPIDTVFANGDECRRFASDADDSLRQSLPPHPHQYIPQQWSNGQGCRRLAP
jgi:hypothetical protein